MKDLFIANLDIVDYVMNGELDKVASVVSDLRDNAQKAYIPSYEEQDEKADKDFAVVLHNSKNEQMRKFACFNGDLTELNMAFLIKAIDELPEEVVKVAATNLTAAAHKFHIPIPDELSSYDSKRYCSRTIHTDNIDIQKYASKTKMVKTASAKTKHALGNKYPISTKVEIQKAAEWFGRNYAKLSVDEQRDFISNVKTESDALGVSLEKTAMADFVGLDETLFNSDFYSHVTTRRSLVKDDQVDIKDTYNDVLRRADSLGAIKVAYILEAIDKEAGLDYYYGKELVDPLRACLGTCKTAGLEIDGAYITPQQIQKLDTGELTELIGNDGVKELRGSDGLAVLASFPSPIRKEILKKL